MNSSRFDSLSRRLAVDSLTRRSVLKQGVVGMAAVGGLGLAGRAVAQDATPASEVESGVELLFVQSGGATTLSPGDRDVHTLTLTDVAAQTLHFSNRPAREAGTTPTEDFLAAWAEGFADSPPNATLIGHLEDGEEAVVVELTEPVYDADAATLSYQVRILEADEIGDRVFEHEPLAALEEGREYTEAHLFIDGLLDCIDWLTMPWQVCQSNR